MGDALTEGKADRNKRLKREALLESAYGLFTQKGFSETTIAEIAAAAGVAKGTFYLYYKDKYDLRSHLIHLKAEQTLNRAYEDLLQTDGGDAIRCGSVEEIIVFFAQNILRQLEQDPALLRFISRNLAWGLLRPNIQSTRPFGQDTSLCFSEVLVCLFRRSPVKYRNPEIMLYMVVEFVGAACYGSIMESEPLPIEELTSYLLDGVRGIIRSQQLQEQQSTGQQLIGSN